MAQYGIKCLKESQYDWVIFPTDLPRSNLVMITAKTPHPTFHKEDKELPVRLFTAAALQDAASSLRHRFIGLNHQGFIEKAFTVDAQYNPTTMNVEALCYFPDEWIGIVKQLLASGKESIFSVEYTWREEKYTPEGVEFIGLCFDQVDLLCGVNAGDKHVSARLAESVLNMGLNRHALCEAEVDTHFPELVQEKKVTDSVNTPSQDFFKYECEANEFMAGSYKECESAVQECMTQRLTEPFAGYKDFDACVAANKDKSNPQAYCGYIKHKVESVSSAQNLKHQEPLTSVRPEDRNPNELLMKDNPISKEGNVIATPQQRPEETNLLNNEPFTPVVNQDPPNVEKPVMNVMSAGFVEDSKGPVGVGGTPSKDKPTFAMSGSTEPVKGGEKLVQSGETGGSANVDTQHMGTKNVQNQDADAGMHGSQGASTSTENPILEIFKTVGIQGTGKEANPVNDGLNKVDGPDLSNEDTYNKKGECKVLTESEKPIEQPKPVEQPIQPDPLKLAEAKIIELTKSNTDLEGAVAKLQENVKTFSNEKEQAVIKARSEGRQEILQKVKAVVPSNSMVSGVHQGAFRVLVNDVKKVLYESENET